MGMFIQYVIFLYMLMFGTNSIQGYSSRIIRKLEIVEGKLNIFIKELEFVKEDLKDEREKSSNLEKRLDMLMDGGKGISVDIKDPKKEVDTVQNHHEQRVFNAFYDEIQERKVFENHVKNVLNVEKVNMETKITTLNETLTAHFETKLKTLEDEVLHSVTGLNDDIASIKDLTISKKKFDTVQHHHEQRVYNALFDEKQERKVFENHVKSVLKDEKVNMEIKFTTLNETLTSHIETQLNTLEGEVLHSVTGLNDSIASIKELTNNEIVNMEMKFTTLNETLTSHIETQLNTLEDEVLHSVTGLNDSIAFIKELTNNEQVNMEMKFTTLNETLTSHIETQLNTLEDEVLHSVTGLNDYIAFIKKLTSNEKVNMEMKFTTLNETHTAHIDTKLKILEDEVLHSVTGLNDYIESIKELTSNVKQNENSITHAKLESEQQNTTLLRHDAMLVSFSDSLVDVVASLVELNDSCHDKGWSGWSSWSTCSTHCGIGLQTSERTCSSTETQLSGKCCVGSDTQTQICTLPACPDPKDCLDVLNQTKNNVNGVYNVTSLSSGLVYPVYCDMTTDGGGWTVFQKRFDGSVHFYRTFKEYEDGFGDVNAEFWMGLKRIHDMTSTHTTELRIDLTAADGSTAYETFQDFSVSPGPDYKLHVGRAAGTAGDVDGLTYTNGMRFSTKDKDVDVWSSIDCAELHHGGWWYKSCSWVNLNGDYATPGTQSSYHSGLGGVIYYNFKKIQSLKTSTMMFRRK